MTIDSSQAPEPPWKRCPGEAPWWSGWRQGEDAWYVHVFLPFWTALDAEQRSAYLARFPPPDSDWKEYLNAYAAEGPRRERDFAADPAPPWGRYPGRGPSWIGWRVWPARRWLRNDFIPFWQLLSPSEQAAYMTKWPPPTTSWHGQLQKWKDDAFR